MDTNKTVILIILKDDKVLLEQRAPGSGLENHFLFPGGKIEVNETSEQAATREGLEELGINPTKLFPLEEFIAHESKRVLCPFVITRWDGEISSIILDKGNPVFWVNLDMVAKSPLESVRYLYQITKNHLSNI